MTAFNRPVFQAHTEIVRVIRQRLGDGTAALFARPERSGDEIAWFTGEPGEVRRWLDLPLAERARLEPLWAALDGQLSGLAASLDGGINTRDGNLAHVLKAAFVVPGPEHLYLVGGRPVLAFWGFRGVGQSGVWPLRSTFPEPPPAPAPVPSRRRLWLWLLALLVLALAVLLVWWLWPGAVPVEPPPPIAKPGAPPPLPTLTPPAPLPQSEPPTPAPEPAPPAKVDLPQQGWDAHDLSILQGCWVLGHDGPAKLFDDNGNAVEGGITRAGQICFNSSGHGQRRAAMDFASGHLECIAPVTSSFDDKGQLVSRQPEGQCSGDRSTAWLPRVMICTRRDDSTADCVDRNPYEAFQYEFRRN